MKYTKQFSFFVSYYEAARTLPNKSRLEFYDAIVNYVFEGKEPELPKNVQALWSLIKPNLDTSIKRSIAGSITKDNQKEIKENQELIKGKSKENQKEIKSETIGIGEGIGKGEGKGDGLEEEYNPPTYEEVKQFCEEENIHLDYKKWYEDNVANDWMIGLSKMVDWKTNLILNGNIILKK